MGSSCRRLNEPRQGRRRRRQRDGGTDTAASLLQELRELRPGEDGLRLLERLDLLVARGLPELKVLNDEITASVELAVIVRQLLELEHDSLLRLLRLDKVRFRLCLLLALVHDVLALRLDGVVRLLYKVLVRLLGVLLRADGLGLHGLSVVDDLLDHAHHTTRTGVLFVRLEAGGRRRPRGLLLLAHRDQGRLIVEALQDFKGLLEQLLRRALVGDRGLELLVLLLAVLTRALQLHL